MWSVLWSDGSTVGGRSQAKPKVRRVKLWRLWRVIEALHLLAPNNWCIVNQNPVLAPLSRNWSALTPGHSSLVRLTAPTLRCASGLATPLGFLWVRLLGW